eukprot:g5012.t1
MNLAKVEHLDRPEERESFVKQTHGFVPKEVLSDPTQKHRFAKKRTQRRAIPRRYRESNETYFTHVPRTTHLDNAPPPSDYFGLYRDPEERRQVLMSDLQRHLAHDLKMHRRALASKDPVSPDKIFGGRRAVEAIRNHTARYRHLPPGEVAKTHDRLDHPVMHAHNPDYRTARDADWAAKNASKHYLTSNESWKRHLQVGLNRHEDATMLLERGAQHILSSGDAAAGRAWRNMLNTSAHEFHAKRHAEGVNVPWVSSGNVDSTMAWAHEADEATHSARIEEEIAARYEEAFETLAADEPDVGTTGEHVAQYRKKIGNEGRRHMRVHHDRNLVLSREMTTASKAGGQKKTSAPSSAVGSMEGGKMNDSSCRASPLPVFQPFSPEEREQSRLKRAAARAKRHEAESGGFHGLTSKEEAERIGLAANRPRPDWSAAAVDDIRVLTQAEREQARLTIAAARAKRKEKDAGGFSGLASAEEAERVGNMRNTFRKVDWDTERAVFREETIGVTPISPKEREQRRLAGARVRAGAHAAEVGDFRGLVDKEEADTIGRRMNYESPKGVIVDVFRKVQTNNEPEAEVGKKETTDAGAEDDAGY